MLFNLRDITLSRYLSLLIIEVRLKSQQQRDSFHWVYYTVRHNLTVMQGFTDRSLAAPLLFIRLFFILLLLSSAGDRNTSSCKSRLTATSRGEFLNISFTCKQTCKGFIALFFSCDEEGCQVCREGSHMLLHQATNTELAFAIQLAHQNRELSVVLYHCHIFHTGLFVHSFIYALPACFCLPPDVPPPPSSSACFSPLVFPVYWTETCWYEAHLHGHKGTSLWCFWSAARSDMSTAPPCTLQWLIMQYNGQAQTAKDAHPRMFSL